MRDREVIDSELRLLAAVRRVCREQGGVPSMSLVRALLDERNTATRSELRSQLGSRPKTLCCTARISGDSAGEPQPGKWSLGGPRTANTRTQRPAWT